MKKVQSNYPYYFILPALLVYMLAYIMPTIMGFFLSFTDWNAYSSKIRFIGIEQFKRVFTDAVVWTSFINTIYYAIGTTFFTNFFALGLALLLDNKYKSIKFFRSVFFFPCILSALIVSYIFSAIFYPTGLFNNILKSIGLHNIEIQWLAQANVSMYVIIFVAAWFGFGILMMIYLSALQSIPEDLISAARLDRANRWQILRHVKLPLIASAFTVNIVYSLIGSLKVFAVVLLLTNGGPGYSTEVVNTLVFKEFTQGRYGYATAIGMLMFLFVCIVVFPVVAILRRREIEA